MRCTIRRPQSSEGVGITSENNDRSLSYETEYVLEGKASDKENLESFLMKLLLVRMALNYVYLMGDSEKQSEAAAFAAAVTTVPFDSRSCRGVKAACSSRLGGRRKVLWISVHCFPEKRRHL